MRKELCYISLLLVLFTSCEQVYQPDIETVNGQLVVEARITNDLSKNFIHLTRTRSFYDKQPPLEVSGAVLTLNEMGTMVTLRASESSPGYYTLNSVPEIGKRYFLRIGILSDIYESAAVTMPPLPAITNFHTEHVVKKVYENSVEGIPQAFDKPGREFYVDLPVTNSLSYFRFDIKTVWEWHCDYIPNPVSEIPSIYGWYVFHDKAMFNLAGPKGFSQSNKIEKHSILNVSYNVLDYIYADTLITKSDTLYAKGCILAIDQYGTSKESFEYHEQLNSQFSAAGNLFDPIQNQIHGNIICKTNASKIVYGFFDLNSYSPHRYFFNLSHPPADFPMRQIYRYPELPDENGMLITQPLQGPPTELPPPKSPPIWWEMRW
jgi:hypothetical protein